VTFGLSDLQIIEQPPWKLRFRSTQHNAI